MNMVLRELRANLKALLIWSACIIIINIMWMSEFSAYHNNPEMAALIDAMPEQLLKAFSMQAANMTTVEGFVSLVSAFIYLILGVHAALLGSSIIAREERDKTAEFLMTLPVSRRQVISGKLTAAVINCLLLLGVTTAVLLLSALKYNPAPGFYPYLGRVTLAAFILQLIFLSLGMLMSSFMRRYKKSGSAAVSILIITYLLSVLTGMSGKIDFLKYFTPFKYFEPLAILNEARFDGVYLLLSGGIIALATAGTYFFYPRRDLFI